MRKLIQHNLEYHKTLDHFQIYLKDRNELSESILDNHNFSNGQFSTLLTEDADLSKLYDFNIGHILPANPTEEIIIDGFDEPFQGEWVNSLDVEFSHFLFEKMKKKKFLSCLMEDLIQSPKDPHVDLYHQIGLHHRSHIFYLINHINLDYKTVRAAIKECSSAWHFVSVLFDQGNQIYINKKISKTNFIHICSDINSIIIGAYDGESYLIWEKDSKL